MKTSSNRPATVKCPSCGTLVEWSPEQPWRPFCSERCKLIDLGTWLDESNRIAGDPAPATNLEQDN